MTKRALAVAAVLSALAASPALVRAAAAAVPATAAGKTASSVPEVKSSTQTPSQIYTGERLRDPFSPPGASGGSGGRGFTTETDFNIHNLSLRGIMKDQGTEYALFADSAFGVSFVLRGGKLYDPRNKAVSGVSGKLKMKEKWAQLETSEHDVQVFRLGEEEKD